MMWLRKHWLFCVSVESLFVAFAGASSAALTRASVLIAGAALIGEYAQPTNNAQHLFRTKDWIEDGDDLVLRVPFTTHRVRNPTITVFERQGRLLRQVMCDNCVDYGDEVVVRVNRKTEPFDGELHLS